MTRSRPCFRPDCIFSLKDRYSVLPGIERETAYAASARPTAQRVLDMIYASGGTMEKGVLLTAFGESDPMPALRELTEQGILTLETSAERNVGDKQEQIAVLDLRGERHTLNSPVAHPANRPFCACWRRCRRCL